MFRAVRQCRGYFLHKLNIASYLQQISVPRLGGQLRVFHVFIINRGVMKLFLFISFNHVRIGIDDNHAGNAIDDYLIPRFYHLCNVAQTGHGGKFHGAGNNCRVRRAAANIRGKADYFIHFHLRRIRRGKVGRDNNHFSADIQHNFPFLSG